MEKKYEESERIREIDWDRVYSEKNLPYIPWISDKPDQEFTELIKSGKISPHSALDVGCGTGTDAIYIASKGINVTAIDISQKAIRMAEEKSEKAGVKVNFIAGDFWKIEFDDGMFDLVSDRGFFHILNPSRREEFAVKVNRLLKNRGFYYLRCMSDKSEGESGPYRISKDIIERTFSKYFDTLETTDVRWGGRGMWSYVCLLSKIG